MTMLGSLLWLWLGAGVPGFTITLVGLGVDVFDVVLVFLSGGRACGSKGGLRRWPSKSTRGVRDTGQEENSARSVDTTVFGK